MEDKNKANLFTEISQDFKHMGERIGEAGKNAGLEVAKNAKGIAESTVNGIKGAGQTISSKAQEFAGEAKDKADIVKEKVHDVIHKDDDDVV